MRPLQATPGSQATQSLHVQPQGELLLNVLESHFVTVAAEDDNIGRLRVRARPEEETTDSERPPSKRRKVGPNRESVISISYKVIYQDSAGGVVTAKHEVEI